jgi:hypothetical protein
VKALCTFVLWNCFIAYTASNVPFSDCLAYFVGGIFNVKCTLKFDGETWRTGKPVDSCFSGIFPFYHIRATH